MLDSFGVPGTLHDQALVAVDKLDKIGRGGVAAELTARGIGHEFEVRSAHRNPDAVLESHADPVTDLAVESS